jgi:hypothetical protein
MNDTIRVGDRVKDNVTCATGTVLYLKFPWAWVLSDAASTPETWPAGKFTRIEPEKVTLMPKYAVGENVQSYVAGAKKGRWTVVEVRVDYLIKLPDGTLDHRVEFQLEPVPEPCPECKGWGVASE